MNVPEMQKFAEDLSEATGRQFTGQQIDIWYSALKGYTPGDCKKALYEHLAQSGGFLTPADVANRVKQMRADRIAAAGTPPNPPEYVEGEDWDEYQSMYLRWQTAWTENVANGVAPPAANQLALAYVGKTAAIEPTVPFRNPLVLKGAAPN